MTTRQTNQHRIFGISPERIYTIEEICDLWGLSRRWIRDNWMKPRQVAHTACGDLVVFLGADIIAWAKRHKTPADAE